MLRQSRQRSARRCVPQQIDLFAENAPAIGGMPAWFGLPMETQAALARGLAASAPQSTRNPVARVRGSIREGEGHEST
jgi:hypothetical protein